MPKMVAYSILGAVGVLILASAALVARGHRMILIDGVLQHGFERSEFYDRGDCSRSPWWFDVTDVTEAGDLHKQWDSLGRPQFTSDSSATSLQLDHMDT